MCSSSPTLSIPVVSDLDVTLALDVLGKRTFGSDQLLATFTVDLEDMFVGTGVTKATDIALEEKDNQQRIVFSLVCEHDVKYM